MRQFLLLSVFVLISGTALSQKDTISFKSTKKKDRQFYFAWGYTRAWYTRSTIHFKNNSGKFNEYRGKPDNYDFTIHNVTAHDRSDFDRIKDVVNCTVPQFVSRLGFMFNSKWGIELNYDHTKYVVDDWQRTHITGQIDGQPLDKDTTMNPGKFLHFEHTDGANFWMLNLIRKCEFYKPNRNFIASLVLKPGAGVVYPRTDVTIFGQELNNAWHVAGWIVGAEAGLRVEFFRNGFFEFVGKGSYADYTHCFILGKGNGNANHQFCTAQLTMTIGMRFDGRLLNNL